MTRAEKKPIIYQDHLEVPEEYLRFATPKEVAEYRAKRLKCTKICEIGAGIGGQTLAFAKQCSEVIAIEKDEKAFKILEGNFKKLKIKNVRIINGDALSEEVIKEIKKESPQIIFCDTERKEKGQRSIKDLKPGIFETIKNYSEITDKIVVEVPPFTNDLNLIKEDFEKEFISLDGKLNRLTLYFGDLKKTKVSAVALPSKERVESEKKVKIAETKSVEGFNFFYLINPALILAGLEDQIAPSDSKKIILENKKFFLSKEVINSNFLEGYKILAICENNFEKIVNNLKEISAGKVILRYSIDPKNYWADRNKFENTIDKLGGKEIHLFLFDKKMVLCEKFITSS
jgi:16S rRNA G966 N2-methylase RsmD